VSQQAGRYQRSFAGMIGALLVLLALVAAFVAFRAINRVEPETPVRAVDYQRTVDFARQNVDLPLLAPPELPTGWRATSVNFDEEPARWHLGVLTDNDRYVGLEQSRSSLRTMVERYVDPDAVPGEPVEVEGRPWRTWTDEGGDTALGRTAGGVTTLVVGSPSREALVDYVASLE
jgi:hypothetical protein